MLYGNNEHGAVMWAGSTAGMGRDQSRLLLMTS